MIDLKRGHLTGFVVFAVVSVLSFAANAIEPAAALPTSRYILPDIGFEMDAPEGFKLRQGMWYHEGLRASLSFAHAKGKDFKSVTGEFTAEGLWKAGHKLIDKSDVIVSGKQGLLVHISNGEGLIKQAGWFVVFPDDDGVCQVSVIFPANKPSEVHEELRKAVLSVKRTKPAPAR